MTFTKIAVGMLVLWSVVHATQISFYTSDAITWETIEPDSIYILNVTQSTDTMLVGRTSFDLGLLTEVSLLESGMPETFYLSNNYPNAFYDKTEFVLNVPNTNDVLIEIYNVLGQRLAHFDGMLPSGVHAFEFYGGGLTNGVYLVRATTAQQVQTLKMLKAGNPLGTDVSLSYRGAGASLAGPMLEKAVHSRNDDYLFTVYADGYIPQMRQVQAPDDGEQFQFELMPVPPPEDFTSKWRGFNLLEKFTVEWQNAPYRESDFEWISEFGFNFVRLPIDYRTYTEEGDWYEFDESSLADIDDAVAWGQTYDIHVSINLHRAPGYCVNPPSQPLPPHQDVSLWEDADAQDAFAEHWHMFAERYQHIPKEALSFNLVNEPGNVDGDTYIKAVRPAIQAIREISPERIIISDAVDWGNAPVDEILDYDVVMSPHFYNPFQLTHYKAGWVDGSDSWPEPSWPPQLVSNGFYGSYKKPLDTSLIIKGNFPAGTELTLRVHQVSSRADFKIKTDGTVVYNKSFQPGPGEGEWREVMYREEWDVYQNIYDRDYSHTLEADAQSLEMRVDEGDWMTFTELHIARPETSGLAPITIRPGITEWGVPQARYRLDDKGGLTVSKAPAGFEDRFKINGFLQKWIDLKNDGVPVHVGEWGVYNKTPHDVTLAFMKNRLMAMKAAGLGWALWNFRGSFGILDSERPDVEYEEFRGHKLDRQMLELLQRY